MLDYQRFMSDSTIDYVNFQQRLLREYFPQTPITTNTWFCDHMPDFYKLFDKLDFCSYDNYPATVLPEEGYYSHAFHLDFIRGVKQKNFWIMEQLSGTPGCWMPTVSYTHLDVYKRQDSDFCELYCPGSKGRVEAQGKIYAGQDNAQACNIHDTYDVKTGDGQEK